jgi:hypothetical protein
MALLILLSCLIPVIGLLIYAWSRSWPQLRKQSDRMSQKNGPRGADFDDFIARKMERLPVVRPTRPPGDQKDPTPPPGEE